MSNSKGFWTKDHTKFFFLFLGIFMLTFLMLFTLGLVPSEISESDNGVIDDIRLNAIEMAAGENPQNTYTEPEPEIPRDPGEAPVRLVVPNAKIDILVQNPTTKDNTVLNEYLTRGVIRYPDSALLGDGNVLIFGHSSNWEVVHNQAYKALNGIEKLKEGDLIYVDSENSRYTYSVTKVTLVDADKEFIDFASGKNMLTLSTCNTFGQKQERYVAEADFVGKESRN